MPGRSLHSVRRLTMWYRPCSGLTSKRLTMSTRRASIVCNRDSGTSSPARRAISPLAAERWLPAHERLCAPFRNGEFGNEEVGQRANLRRPCPSSGCYEIQTAFGQSPIGQNGFKLLVQEI